MPKMKFRATAGLAVLGDLVRLTFPPAGRREIAEQGLALISRTISAEAGVLLLRDSPSAAARAEAVWGEGDHESLEQFGRRCLELGDPVCDEGHENGVPVRASLLLPGDVGALGALVFSRPALWDDDAQAFARSAARILSGAVRTHRTIVESRDQRELLFQRNLELEILGELAARLQEAEGRDPELLQAALDLVLERLGLDAGWIFWGEQARGQLELAASRGVSERFAMQARRDGVGTCLCEQVFHTGRLQYARNTTDCPRMPHLVPGAEGTAHACIPLKFERGVLGVLNIAARPGSQFSTQELQFLETAAKQVSMAVDRASNSRAERRRNAEARAFAALARAIGGSVDRERVLAAIGEYAQDLLAAERAAIFLGDGTDPLVLGYLSGPPFPEVAVGGEVDFATVGARTPMAAIAQRRVVAFEDTVGDERVNPEVAARWGVGSGLVVPLIAHDAVLGILLATRPGPSTWSPEQVEIAEGLGQQAALSIENAQLFAEIQDTLRRLREAQDAMVRAERLAAVGTLAASLAHEVRNPLNSINLQLVLLSRRLGRLDPAERTEMTDLVDTARMEIARLDSLVQEALSLAKIDRLTLVPANPEDATREVVDLMRPVASEKGIGLRAEFAGDMPRIPLDREKLKQVLINLVRNAIEAMTDGGDLTVSTSREGGSIVIRVADTGPGIDTTVDPFDLFVTTKADGTGLGLPIARRIVEAHGGNLSCSSKPGRGATFTVTLKGS